MTVAQTHVRMGQRVWMGTTRLLVGVLRDTLATYVTQVRYVVLYTHLLD